MSMKQTGNRANVFTTFFVASFKKQSLILPIFSLFACLVKSNETLSTFTLFYCYLDLWEGQ